MCRTGLVLCGVAPTQSLGAAPAHAISRCSPPPTMVRRGPHGPAQGTASWRPRGQGGAPVPTTPPSRSQGIGREHRGKGASPWRATSRAQGIASGLTLAPRHARARPLPLPPRPRGTFSRPRLGCGRAAARFVSAFEFSQIPFRFANWLRADHKMLGNEDALSEIRR